MREHDAELLNDSYERCLVRPGFLERFYQIFTQSSDAVARKFAHTDLVKQRRMLKVSLYLLMSAAGTPTPEVSVHLQRIAAIHGKAGHGIEPELYDLWLDCLLEAVREFDPLYDRAIDAAWRHALAASIQVMKSGY